MKKLVFALALLCCLPALAQDCAVVLMHGKWGGPKSPYLKGIAEKMGAVCQVELREMPWSRNRAYDETYEAALEKLAASVAQYRQKGVRRVFLGGQSFGANAAMAYQAQIGNADGVIALAPGHSPSYMYETGLTRSAISLAQELIAQGRPESVVQFTDLNQGEKKTFSIRADVFNSYFRPDGLGNMALSAARFKNPTPFLWVIGTLDPLYPSGAAYAFDKVPAHPASKYLVVSANHATTPEVAADQVVAWLSALMK